MSLWLGILNVIDRKIDIIDNEIEVIDGKLNVINAKIDIIDGLHDVPDIDSANNDFIRDVIGNKNDTHDGTSIRAISHILNEHTHSMAKVYPRLDNPVLLTKDTGVWAAIPATKTEIIPAGTIGEDFDIHWVQVDSISANGDYIVCLYGGGIGSEVLIGEIAVSRSAAQSQEGSTPIMTPIMPDGTRISAGISAGNNAQNTLSIKLMYHEY